MIDTFFVKGGLFEGEVETDRADGWYWVYGDIDMGDYGPYESKAAARKAGKAKLPELEAEYA